MKNLKKLLSLAVALVMALSMLTVASITSFAAENEYTLGDVDGSGKITAADARIVLRNSASLEVLSDEQKAAADIDGNGNVTAADARIILRISASLDSINNYISVEPDFDTLELSNYILTSPDYIAEQTGLEFKLNEDTGYTESDEFLMYVSGHDNDYDGVTDEEYVELIALEKANDYTIFGVSVGMSSDEAVKILTDAGHEAEVDDDGYIGFIDNESGINLFAMADEDGMINYVEVYYYFVDLGYIIGLNVEWFGYYFPGFEPSDGVYKDDIIEVRFTPYGYSYMVKVTKQAQVGIYTLVVGMSQAEVDELIEYYECKTVSEDYYVVDMYDDNINEILEITFSDGVVTSVSLTRGAYPDLSTYIYFEEDFLLSDMDGLTVDDEHAVIDGEICYSLDNMHFIVSELDGIREVAISGESEHNILGIKYGTDLYEAIDCLSWYGLEATDDDTYYESEDGYYYAYMESADGETVSSITFGVSLEYEEYM